MSAWAREYNPGLDDVFEPAVAVVTERWRFDLGGARVVEGFAVGGAAGGRLEDASAIHCGHWA